jgi:hypothetical protein
MPNDRSVLTLIRDHRTLFMIIAVGLFLLELEIFALAAMKSGRKSTLQVFNDRGQLIHETDGRQLSDFNRYYFEKTFGPFENYDVRLSTRDVPFPFRAWFASAVGIPVGVVLLFSFVVKAWAALFYGEKAGRGLEAREAADADNRFERIVATLGRFNIFTIGFLIFVAVLAYWVLPNLITYLGRIGIEALTRYKWIFIGAAGFLALLVLWIVYLRYLLAKKSIESQVELDKYRLQLEWEQSNRPPLQLEYEAEAAPEGPTIECRPD